MVQECVWHGRCGSRGVYVWRLFDGSSLVWGAVGEVKKQTGCHWFSFSRS